MYYNKYINCHREHSDHYTNTPGVSLVRNGTPRLLFLIADSYIEPEKASVEFYNYESIMPYGISKSITAREPDAFIQQHDPEMDVPFSDVVQVPHGAIKFRVKTPYGHTNFAPIHNREKYLVTHEHLYQLVE